MKRQYKGSAVKVNLIESGQIQEDKYPLDVEHSYLAQNTFVDFVRGKPVTRTITPRELFVYQGKLQDTSESMHLKYLNSLSDETPDFTKDEAEKHQLSKVKYKGLDRKDTLLRKEFIRAFLQYAQKNSINFNASLSM